jgi:hypothetical protein
LDTFSGLVNKCEEVAEVLFHNVTDMAQQMLEKARQEAEEEQDDGDLLSMITKEDEEYEMKEVIRFLCVLEISVR